MRQLNKLLFILLFLFIASPSFAVTWYVRTDGGHTNQCDGQHDAALAGAVDGADADTLPDCALNHPIKVLGSDEFSQKMSGGDTLIIKDGSYVFGYGMPNSSCATWNSWWCGTAKRPPSGTSGAHTKILGEHYADGCATKPELWGYGGTTRGIYQILDISQRDYVDIQCLELTDHEPSGCSLAYVPGSSGLGRTATVGITVQNATDFYFKDLDIHGISGPGINGGALNINDHTGTCTLENVRLVGNGEAGWNADGRATDYGNVVFKNVTGQWNGCVENYPNNGNYDYCAGQGQTCFSDGYGAGDSDINVTLEDSDFSYNSQDGFDALHLGEGGSLTVRRSKFEGNSGNGLKSGAGDVVVENNIMISGCDYIGNYKAAAPLNDNNIMGNGSFCDSMFFHQAFFTGGGLNDVNTNGSSLSGSKPGCSNPADCKTFYYITVDSVGTPDTFAWNECHVSPQTNSTICSYSAANVPFSTSNTDLAYGAKIKWMSTTGHMLGDKWYMEYGPGHPYAVHGSYFNYKCGVAINITGHIPDDSYVTWDSGNSNGYLKQQQGNKYYIEVRTGTLDVNDTVTNGTYSFKISTLSTCGKVRNYNVTGKDDLIKVDSSFNGNYDLYQPKFYVTIDSVGTPDTFKWVSTDTTTVFGPVITSVPLATTDTVLGSGVTIKWGSTTGHTIGDTWYLTVTGCGFDNYCRAGGEPLAWDIQGGANYKFYNNTIVQLVSTKNNGIYGWDYPNCNGTEHVEYKNNIIVGGNYQLIAAPTGPCTGWSDSADIDEDYDVRYQIGNPRTGVGTHMQTAAPGFINSISYPSVFTPGLDYGITNLGSAYNTGTESITFSDNSNDYNNYSRGSAYDIGALQYGSVPTGTVCGNNSKESGEICDGTDLNSQTCVTQGYASGTLACSGSCLSFDTSSCVASVCGNSIIETGEICDGTSLNGQTCVTQGYTSGTLTCASCTSYNTSGCSTPGTSTVSGNRWNGSFKKGTLQ